MLQRFAGSSVRFAVNRLSARVANQWIGRQWLAPQHNSEKSGLADTHTAGLGVDEVTFEDVETTFIGLHDGRGAQAWWAVPVRSERNCSNFTEL